MAAAFLLISAAGYLATRSRPVPPALPSPAPQTAVLSPAPAAAAAEAVVTPLARSVVPAPEPAPEKEKRVSAATPSRSVAGYPATPSRPSRQQPAAPLPAPVAAAGKAVVEPLARSGAPAPGPAPEKEKGVSAATPSRSVVYTFPVVHRHAFGSCRGTLQVAPDAISFFSEKEKDSFRLEHGAYSVLVSADRLTVQSRSRTYNFKSAIARNRSENATELGNIARCISGVQLPASPGN